MFFEDLGFDDFLTKFCRMNLKPKAKMSVNKTTFMLDGLEENDGLSLTTLETTLESQENSIINENFQEECESVGDCFECENILDSDLSFGQRNHEHEKQRTLLDYYTVVSK